MLGLSKAAQRDRKNLSTTVLALATQQEGLALAVEGEDLDQMERKLDEAADLISRGDPDQPDAQYFYSDAFLEMQRGMAYRLAKLWDKAIVSLTRGMAGLDRNTLASEWATWYVAELARAYAGKGEPDLAVSHASRALVVAKSTEGSRLQKSVADLQTEMAARWPDHPDVMTLGEELSA